MKVAAEDLPIFEAFFLEASENIKTVEQNLLNFEKTGDLESLKQAFRGIHTIKGVAASLGIVPLEQLSHKLEDILDFNSTIIKIVIKFFIISPSILDKKNIL